MELRRMFLPVALSAVAAWSLSIDVLAQGSAPASSSSSSSSASGAKRGTKSAPPSQSGVDAGAITNGVYINKTFAFSCKIPPGWVLRTEELNAREEKKEKEKKPEDQKGEVTTGTQPSELPASSAGAKVLLAAFSRPPEAHGEDINASIVIAAESATSYPGLKEAAQYFFPLTEVAKAQGFTADEDPYEIVVGPKTLIRGDFHKDVGSRVMRQSTLAMLSHGYAVSITVIGGTDDEVEDLVDGLTFTAR